MAIKYRFITTFLLLTTGSTMHASSPTLQKLKISKAELEMLKKVHTALYGECPKLLTDSSFQRVNSTQILCDYKATREALDEKEQRDAILFDWAVKGFLCTGLAIATVYRISTAT